MTLDRQHRPGDSISRRSGLRSARRWSVSCAAGSAIRTKPTTSSPRSCCASTRTSARSTTGNGSRPGCSASPATRSPITTVATARRREVVAAELEPGRRPERRRLARRPSRNIVRARFLHPATGRRAARPTTGGRSNSPTSRATAQADAGADGRHLGVRHEVAGPARPPPVRDARQAVLRRHHRQPRRPRRLPPAPRRYAAARLPLSPVITPPFDPRCGRTIHRLSSMIDEY